MSSGNYAIIALIIFFCNILIVLIIPIILYIIKFKYEFEIFQFIYKANENRIRRIDTGIKDKLVIKRFIFKQFLDFEWHNFDEFLQKLDVTNRYKIKRIINNFSIDKNTCLLRQEQGKYELSFYKLVNNEYQINIKYSNYNKQCEITQFSSNALDRNKYISIITLNINLQKFKNIDNIYYLLSNFINTSNIYTYSTKRLVNLIIVAKNKLFLNFKVKKFIVNNSSLFNYICVDNSFKFYHVKKIVAKESIDYYFNNNLKQKKDIITKNRNINEVEVIEDIIYKYKNKKPFAKLWKVELNHQSNCNLKYNMLKKKIYDKAINHLKITQNNNKITNFLLLEFTQISKNILNRNKQVLFVLNDDMYFEDNYTFLADRKLPISIYIKYISEQVLDMLAKKSDILYVFIDSNISSQESNFKNWFLYNLMIIAKNKNFQIISYTNQSINPLFFSEYAIKYYID